ncbi:MAG: extradiol dioxygenase, partial [Phycisphaerales bacterium]|nr:extradiol dioxygenase [Phycisphaerales bacterium]
PFFWIGTGDKAKGGVHIALAANSRAQVDDFYAAAIAAGARDNGKPGPRPHYDPRYYAANIFDPDGYSIEVVFKSWQHA